MRFWHGPDHLWLELDAPYSGRMSAQELDTMVGRLRETIDRGELRDPRVRLAIADRKTDAYIGGVSRYWEDRDTLWASVGVNIHDSERWGRGLGFEALGLWIEYLFAAFPDWVRVGCTTWSGNERMMGLARKLGLEEEARIRMARVYRGEHFDSVGYGILRTEWEALYPDGFAAALAARRG